MTTIHMEIGAARGLVREIMRVHDSIARIIQSTNGTVNGVPQFWRGNSATEFMGLYGDSISRASGVLGPLREIAAELEKAIQEMEQIAERLSE